MSKIEYLKKINKCETSEELFEIETPPDYQCPYIDSLLKKVSEIEHYANYKNENEEELKEKLDDIYYQITYFEDELESLRKAIEGVRNWGTEWKYRAKTMFEKYGSDIEEMQ